MIGKVEKLSLREVWRHEAFDFSVLFEQNSEVLDETLDLGLANVEREKSTGGFFVDLVGEARDGNMVVIETQLEKSEHDHLGKLITYLSSLDAKVGIWIVSNPRPEHVTAVSWLNEGSSAKFYLLEVEAIRIDDFRPAPLFTLITGPSEATSVVGRTKEKFPGRL